MGDKGKIRVEAIEEGPLKLFRPHRQFFGHGGRGAVSKPILFELEYDDSENLAYALCDDSEILPGRSAKSSEIPGLVLTVEPDLFGTDADRLAAGKRIFRKLEWGVWQPYNLEDI